MKLKSLLKVIDKDTYLYFEDNSYSTLGACYKDDFKTTFKGHIYLDKEIEKIRYSSTLHKIMEDGLKELDKMFKF